MFLDEIGELPLELQPKLLDVLERRVVTSLGSEEVTSVDFRLLTATHQNLRQAIVEKRFREDLYYRLAVVELELPPLRERTEDIPLLLNLFLHRLFPERAMRFDDAATQALLSYLWPGNIRQLRNVIESAGAVSDKSLITLEDVYLPQLEGQAPPTPPPSLSSSRDLAALSQRASSQGSLKSMLEVVERQLLLEALEACNWKVSKAAQQLEISRVWLYNRMKKFGLPLPSKQE